MNPSELWWRVAPTGAAISETVVAQIAAGKCVLLDAARLPFKAELRAIACSELYQIDAALNFNEIDAGDFGACDPLDALGGYFGVDQIPSRSLILQQLGQMHSCCWVHGIDAQAAQAWLALARELYTGKAKLNFRLVLELPEVNIRGIGRLAVIDTNIARFDVYYFALSLLATGRLGKDYREYAATLCAELARGDIELCHALCRNIDAVLADPVRDCGLPMEEAEIAQLVCLAQTRSIGPLVDIGRMQLIALFAGRLALILPQVDDYGNTLDDVNRVELRHLVHFFGARQLNATKEEADMLYCLYNARNDIAHLDSLSYERIKGLFSVLERLRLTL